MYRVYVNNKLVFEGYRLKDCPKMKIPKRSLIRVYDGITGEIWEMTRSCLSKAISKVEVND